MTMEAANRGPIPQELLSRLMLAAALWATVLRPTGPDTLWATGPRPTGPRPTPPPPPGGGASAGMGRGPSWATGPRH